MSTIDINQSQYILCPASQDLFQEMSDSRAKNPDDIKKIKLASHTLGECQAFEKEVPLSSDHIL